MKAAACKFHEHDCRGRPDFWRIDRARLELHTPIAQDNNVSEVWKGSFYDPITSRMHDVAVKFFPLDECGPSCAKIIHEMDLLCLASARCQNVCKAFGWSSDEKGVYIVMKLYIGSVCARMREYPHGKLPLPMVRRYGKQLCAALIDLHEQGIVVADLKPSNFLLDELDNLVVSDFGISTLQNTALERCDDGVYGTFNYMSPEAFDTEAYGKLSPKSDAWAFACCVIEMISGIMPWLGKAMAAICFKVTQTSERPLIPAEIPAAVRDALQRCFASEPVNRPSMRNLLEVFEAWDRESSSGGEAGGEHLNGRESFSSFASSRRSVAEEDGGGAAWRQEKEQLKSTVKGLRDKLLSTQEVSRILREQLYVVVGTLKEQQDQASASRREPCGSCTEERMAAVELQNQLRQCTKQRDMAKRMLALESDRSKRLAADLEALHASRRLHSLSFLHPKPSASAAAHLSLLGSHAALGHDPEAVLSRSTASAAHVGTDSETLLSSGDLRRSDLDSQASTPALGSARSVTSVSTDWPQASGSVPVPG